MRRSRDHHRSMTSRSLIETVQEVLARRPELELAIVFGSVALGVERIDSDVDLQVVLVTRDRLCPDRRALGRLRAVRRRCGSQDLMPVRPGHRPRGYDPAARARRRTRRARRPLHRTRPERPRLARLRLPPARVHPARGQERHERATQDRHHAQPGRPGGGDQDRPGVAGREGGSPRQPAGRGPGAGRRDRRAARHRPRARRAPHRGHARSRRPDAPARQPADVGMHDLRLQEADRRGAPLRHRAPGTASIAAA